MRLKRARSEEHTSELQSLTNLVCRLLLEKKLDTAWHNTRNEPCHLHVKRSVQEAATSAPTLAATSGCDCVLPMRSMFSIVFFFFNDRGTPEIYPLSLHDALPISLTAILSSARRSQTSPRTTARQRRLRA